MKIESSGALLMVYFMGGEHDHCTRLGENQSFLLLPQQSNTEISLWVWEVHNTVNILVPVSHMFNEFFFVLLPKYNARYFLSDLFLCITHLQSCSYNQ